MVNILTLLMRDAMLLVEIEMILQVVGLIDEG